MLKLLKILLLLLTLFLVSNCENKERLKDINEIAIVTFKFNKNIYEVYEESFLNFIYNEPLKQHSFNEDSKQIEYYDNFIKRFYERLNSTSLVVKPTSTYSNNEDFLYKKFSKKFSKNNYYVSQGYINANLDKNYLKIPRDKVAQKLCKIIDVDAVASFSFRFFQIKAPALDSRKFGIVSYLVLKNKKGQTIFNRTIYAMSPFHPYEFPIDNNDLSLFISLDSKDNIDVFYSNIDQDYTNIEFEFSPENIIYLKELEEIFFAKLQSIISNPYQKDK